MASRRRLLPLAGALLLVAAALVGVAIAVDGTAARVLNGIGALGWLVAAAILVKSLRGSRRGVTVGSAAAAVILLLALVVRPSDLAAALVGFAAAGTTIALIGRDRPVEWALAVPAFWLPVHLTLAVGRAAVAGEARVRTDPPPTAALVPLAMVLAALAGGLVVARLRDQRQGGPVRAGDRVDVGAG